MSPPRPSGPGWEKYQKEERAHWKKHGKSSGKYHYQHGQRWKLDRKAEAGKPIRFSPKSVDVKNQESRDHTSKREKKIKAQTSKNADKSLANAKRAKINSQGKEHHHNTVIDRVDKGLTTKYGGKIPEHVHKKHNKVGVYFGDDRRNFIAANPKVHKQIHKEYNALDNALKALQDTIPEFTRNKLFKGGLNAISGIAGKALDRAEMAHDLFTFGRDGEELVNSAADVVPGLRANPENDLGKKMSDAYQKASDMNYEANGLNTM